MIPEKPPCFLRVPASAGRRVGKSKSFYSHLSFPFPIFPARVGVRGVQPGVEAEVSGMVLVPRSLAVPVCSQLQLVLFVPVSPLHPATSSAVPVCVHTSIKC